MFTSISINPLLSQSSIRDAGAPPSPPLLSRFSTPDLIRHEMEANDERRSLFQYLGEEEKEQISLLLHQISDRATTLETFPYLLSLLKGDSYNPNLWLDPIFSSEEIDALSLFAYFLGEIDIERLGSLHTISAALREGKSEGLEARVVPLFLSDGDVNQEARDFLLHSEKMGQEGMLESFFERMRHESPIDCYFLLMEERKIDTVMTRIITMHGGVNLLYNTSPLPERRFHFVPPFRALFQLLNLVGGPYCPKPIFHYGFGDPLIMREEHIRGKRTVTLVPSFAPLKEMVADGFSAPGECMTLHDFYHLYVISFIPPSHIKWYAEWSKELTRFQENQPLPVQHLLQIFIDGIIDIEFRAYERRAPHKALPFNLYNHIFIRTVPVVAEQYLQEREKKGLPADDTREGIAWLLRTLVYPLLSRFLQKTTDFPDIAEVITNDPWIINDSTFFSLIEDSGKTFLRPQTFNKLLDASVKEKKRVAYYHKKHEQNALAPLISLACGLAKTKSARKLEIDQRMLFSALDESQKEEMVDRLEVVEKDPALEEKLTTLLLHLKNNDRLANFWGDPIFLDRNIDSYVLLLYLGRYISLYDLSFLHHIASILRLSQSAGWPPEWIETLPLFKEDHSIRYQAWLIAKHIPGLEDPEMRSQWFLQMQFTPSLNHYLLFVKQEPHSLHMSYEASLRVLAVTTKKFVPGPELRYGVNVPLPVSTAPQSPLFSVPVV